MVTYVGALVDDYAVVVVPMSVIADEDKRADVRDKAWRVFHREIVLAAPTRHAKVHFHGRADLTRLASKVRLDSLKWRWFSA